MNTEIRGDVQVTGRSSPVPGTPAQFVAELEITNRGMDTAFVNRGTCAFALRAFPSASRSGRAAWDNSPENTACFLSEIEGRIPPGETSSTEAGRFTSREVLGDSLPAGRYFFAIVLRRDERIQLIPAGDQVLTR